MKILYFIWILALCATILISVNYRNETTDFHGIAETSEIVINSEKQVEIKKVHVVPGQSIKKGDLLVEFNRPELTMEINKIFHRIEELKTRKKVDTKDLKSQIDFLKAEKRKITSDIQYRIRQYEAQYKINRELSAELRSVPQSDAPGIQSGNPIQIRIQSLKKELELAVNPIRIRIRALENEMGSGEDPVKVRTERLEKELNLLLQEKNSLYIFARINGIIGAVNVRIGEKVSPFTPILTLHAKSPSYVRGFVHENVYNRIAVGDKVAVISFADMKKRVIGMWWV